MRKEISLEEQVGKLQRMNRILLLSVVGCFVALGLTTWWLFQGQRSGAHVGGDLRVRQLVVQELIKVGDDSAGANATLSADELTITTMGDQSKFGRNIELKAGNDRIELSPGFGLALSGNQENTRLSVDALSFDSKERTARLTGSFLKLSLNKGRKQTRVDLNAGAGFAEMKLWSGKRANEGFYGGVVEAVAKDRETAVSCNLGCEPGSSPLKPLPDKSK